MFTNVPLTPLTHPIGGTRKRSWGSTNADHISLETVFFLAICRHSGEKWQSKTLFLTIFLSTFVDSINVFHCCLSGVFKPNGLSQPYQLEDFIFQSKDCWVVHCNIQFHSNLKQSSAEPIFQSKDCWVVHCNIQFHSNLKQSSAEPNQTQR